jgi:hypothetical protein
MSREVVMAQQNVTIEPAIQSLEQLYIFRRPEEVTEFLQTHPFLVPLLEEAYGQVARHFGSSPEIVLEVVPDPEAHGSVEMFGYILTSLMPGEAGERLERFDREWFLSQVQRTKCLLNFDVEFQ